MNMQGNSSTVPLKMFVLQATVLRTNEVNCKLYSVCHKHGTAEQKRNSESLTGDEIMTNSTHQLVM